MRMLCCWQGLPVQSASRNLRMDDARSSFAMATLLCHTRPWLSKETRSCKHGQAVHMSTSVSMHLGALQYCGAASVPTGFVARMQTHFAKHIRCHQLTRQSCMRALPAAAACLVGCAITAQYLVLQQLQLAAQLVSLLGSRCCLGLFLLQRCLKLPCLHLILQADKMSAAAAGAVTMQPWSLQR